MKQVVTFLLLVSFASNLEAMQAFKFKFTTEDLIQAIKCNNVGRVKVILARGVDPNSRDKNNCTPLNHAVIEKNTEIVKILLAAGADHFTWGCGSKAPLWYAIEEDYLEGVKLLLAAGIPFNEKAAYYYNGALSTAFENRRTKIIQLLLAAGADPNYYHMHGGEFSFYCLCCNP